MQNKRYSKQREAIIQYLAGTDRHPTAEEIYAAVREQYPGIGIATVYRNLNQLSESGEIRKLECGGSDRFDYRTSDHGHFTCTCCGRVYDVFADASELKAEAEQAVGKVDFCELMFYGVCRACLDKGMSMHETA